MILCLESLVFIVQVVVLLVQEINDNDLFGTLSSPIQSLSEPSFFQLCFELGLLVAAALLGTSLTRIGLGGSFLLGLTILGGIWFRARSSLSLASTKVRYEPRFGRLPLAHTVVELLFTSP